MPKIKFQMLTATLSSKILQSHIPEQFVENTLQTMTASSTVWWKHKQMFSTEFIQLNLEIQVWSKEDVHLWTWKQTDHQLI